MLRELAVFADKPDQSLHGPRQTAIPPVAQSKLAPQVDSLHAEQLHLAGLHLVARKASLMNETPASAPTKRLIMPMVGSSMLTRMRDR